MIKITSLYKSFASNQVLNGIDLELKNSGIIAVLGPNSSGKTTLIKSILGLVIPQSGSIELNGKSVLHDHEYRNEIGYLPQIARFPQNLSVREILQMIKNLRMGESRAEEMIGLFGLESFMDKKLGNLSGGTIQKVNIVQALMFDSPILFLDEPTAGLDPVSLIKLKQLIIKERAKGKMILITTHIMTLVEELADELIFLLEGKIHFRGKVSELKDRYSSVNLELAIARMVEGDFKPVSKNGYAKKIYSEQEIV
jgi:Cu-processing system ATP-binding protein